MLVLIVFLDYTFQSRFGFLIKSNFSKKPNKMAGDEEKAEGEKDTELDLIAEQELLRLMRQFRVI